MIAVGVDVHKRQCTVAIEWEDGELRCFGPKPNTREGWRSLLEKLPAGSEIALEVSTSGYFAMRVLEEEGWRQQSHWVHSAGVESLRKQEYDRLDAKRLARKLSVREREPLPEAWFPPPAIRELTNKPRPGRNRKPPRRLFHTGLRHLTSARRSSLEPSRSNNRLR